MKLGDVQFSMAGPAAVARLSGEVDLSNAASIGQVIAETTSNEVHMLILDVSELDYLDSAGIHLIYKLREQLRTRGQLLTVVIPAESPANDALRLAGVTPRIPVFRSLDEAVSHHAG